MSEEVYGEWEKQKPRSHGVELCVVLGWSAVVDSSYGTPRISLPEGITYHNITPSYFLFKYTLLPNNTECFETTSRQ
jgi:hypothetical protein